MLDLPELESGDVKVCFIDRGWNTVNIEVYKAGVRVEILEDKEVLEECELRYEGPSWLPWTP